MLKMSFNLVKSHYFKKAMGISTKTMFLNSVQATGDSDRGYAPLLHHKAIVTDLHKEVERISKAELEKYMKEYNKTWCTLMNEIRLTLSLDASLIF